MAARQDAGCWPVPTALANGATLASTARISPIAAWRVELLDRILRVVLVLGTLTALPSMVVAWSQGRMDLVGSNLLALGTVAVVTFGRRLPHLARVLALLAAAAGIGGFLLVSVGPVGHVYLLAVPVLAALLLGLRAAVAALVATSTLLLVMAAAGVLDRSANVGGFDGVLDTAMVTLNVLFVGGVLALSCGVLLERLDHQRSVLDARNQELEHAVAERARAEEQLWFHSLLLDAVGDAVVATDLHDRIRYANPAAVRLHGWSDGVPIGQRSGDLNAHGLTEQQLTELHANLREGRTWSGELTVTRTDGTRVPTLLTTAPYHDRHGQIDGLIAVATDISQLQAVIDQLARSEGVRLAFLRATSHELRTPLAAIVGFAETLRRHADRLSRQEHAHLLARLDANARTLSRLVTDLLDVDRLSLGLVEADRQPCRVDELIRRVVDETVDDDDRELRLTLAPVEAAVDVAKLERVVANLVANAVRHTPAGVAVAVSLHRDGDRTVLRVDDDGPGIAPDHLESIFEPFVQGPERASAAQPGTGIGLTLVRELTALHDGQVTATNRPDGGARFEVVLPDPRCPGDD